LYERLDRERKAKIARQRVVEKIEIAQLFANVEIIRLRETTRLREAKTIQLAIKKKLEQQEMLREFNEINRI